MSATGGADGISEALGVRDILVRLSDGTEAQVWGLEDGRSGWRTVGVDCAILDPDDHFHGVVEQFCRKVLDVVEDCRAFIAEVEEASP